MKVKLFLVHPELKTQEKYQEIKETYIDFLPVKGDYVAVAGVAYITAERIFNIDENIVKIFVEKLEYNEVVEDKKDGKRVSVKNS